MQRNQMRIMEKALILNIQILRAFAAIIVVLFHTYLAVISYGFEHQYLKLLTANIEHWGAFGVDIFFVISGYLMFMINNKKSRTPYEFLVNRITRIVPIYWFLTILLFIVFQFAPSVFREMGYSPLKLVSSLFFVSRQFGFTDPALYVGWTLEYEMFFYVLFALALFCKCSNAIRLILLTIMIGASIYMELYAAIAIEFAYGGLIFILCDKVPYLKKLQPSNHFWWLIIAMLMMVILMPAFAQEYRFIYWGIPSAIIFFSVLFIKQINLNALVKLGDASYSIYLIQVFTIPVSAKILEKLMPEASGILIFMISAIFSIVVGYLFYLAVEKHLNVCIKKVTLTILPMFKHNRS